VNHDDKGSDGNIEKCGWLSNGPLRPIEVGLPLFSNVPPSFDINSSPNNDKAPNKSYMKDFKKMYKSLIEKYPDSEASDENTQSEYSKSSIGTFSHENSDHKATNDLRLKVSTSSKPTQRFPPVRGRNRRGNFPQNTRGASQIPFDAHLQTFGGIIPYFDSQIFEEDTGIVEDNKNKKVQKETGITGSRSKTSGDQSSQIREIHFRTIRPDEIDEHSETTCAVQPLDLGTFSKRSGLEIVKMPGSEDDPTCKQCMKRYFDPSMKIPFVPSDSESDFPLDILYPDAPIQPGYKRSLSSLSEASTLTQNQVSIIDPKINQEEIKKTTLLDTSQQDILFTVQKVPFTRHDIAELKAFHRHWENIKMEKKQQAAMRLSNRSQCVRETFHSKKAFSRYLELLEEECQRIRSGLIGKSKFKKVSLWEEAVKSASGDKACLRLRREFWWRVAAYVKSIGGIKDTIERTLVSTIREILMSLHPVEPSLFWDILESIPQGVLENVPALKIIEFCRISLSIDQVTFGHYLDKNNISRQIYNQTILNNISRDNMEKMNEIAKGPIEVPEPN